MSTPTKCPRCGELEQRIARLRSELAVIFHRLDESTAFGDGLQAGLAGVVSPHSGHEVATDEDTDFHEGHEVGLRIKDFLKGTS